MGARKLKLHALVKEEQLKYLRELLPGSAVINKNKEHAGNQKVKGRFADINFDKEITLEYGNVEEKQNRYEQLLTSMLTDQWKWIKDHTHKRIIDESNAVASLRMAEEATMMAQKF